MITRARVAAAAMAALAAAAVWAQAPSRVATSIASLRAAPVFYHGKPVAVLGSIAESRDIFRLEPMSAGGAVPSPTGLVDVSDKPIFVYWRERPTRTSGEIRGEFWDLGRLTEGDTRFSNYDFRPLLEATTQGRWPGRDQMFVIIGATLVEAVLPDSPSLRAIVLAPEKYENRSVTLSGRFRGRNLLADVASPLQNPGKWDFVIQSADASIWVTGVRPKGKDFDLDPGSRMDTRRWVQVTGTVRHEISRVWLEGREIELSSAPDETPLTVDVPITPPEPPPTVVFSAPVADETEVDARVIVRVQFSRDMDARSFKDHIRVTYVPPMLPGKPPVAPPPPPVWAFNYNVGSRGIELKFARPLEPFQAVRIELLAGIKAIDGEPMQPWALTFMTGR
ncbi:MAG TPA: Ig-like domain-containing protein [Vicinamibacterales bacterium]|nr:Ig-like domain-containing protein [Vicinamibacterales bacterium]